MLHEYEHRRRTRLERIGHGHDEYAYRRYGDDYPMRRDCCDAIARYAFPVLATGFLAWAIWTRALPFG